MSITHSIFGKNTNPTVYYFCGFGGTIKRLKPHIQSLVWAGYRVVALEYLNDTLECGKPEKLVESLESTLALIKQDSAGREVAGVYAISLGAWFAENTMKELGIERGVFNGASCDLVSAIWNARQFTTVKKAFQENGYNDDDLIRIWLSYDMTQKGSGFNNKHLLIMNSSSDEGANILEVRRNVEAWRALGNTVDFIEISRLGHVHSIIRNMFRVRRIAQFFRSSY